MVTAIPDPEPNQKEEYTMDTNTTYRRAFGNGYRTTYFRGRPSSPMLCARTRAELARAHREFQALINEPPSQARHRQFARQLGVIRALERLIARWEPFPHLNG